MPALSTMAPLLRRRLSPLGRTVLQAVWDCQRERVGMPMVFASRYGDAERSLALLEDLVCNQEVSPTGFTMSTHNAIGAMYSIARGERSNTVCVAAGRASAAMGLVEAAALLADGAPEVLLVSYDDALPFGYAVFRDEPPCAWAWAWRVALPASGEPVLALRAEAAEGDECASAELPAGLDLLRFMLVHHGGGGEAALEQVLEGRRWHFSFESSAEPAHAA
jgi:hypothetical protein